MGISRGVKGVVMRNLRSFFLYGRECFAGFSCLRHNWSAAGWSAAVRGVSGAGSVFVWDWGAYLLVFGMVLVGGAEHWAIILWGLDTFLIFPDNFLRS